MVRCRLNSFLVKIYDYCKQLQEKYGTLSVTMKAFIIDNVKVYTKAQIFKPGCVVIKGDRISAVYTEEEYKIWRQNACFKEGEAEVLDGEDAYLIPGLIDIHFHGCNGFDFCDGTQEAIWQIARYQLSVGVTSICPAVMTLKEDELVHILVEASCFHRRQNEALSPHTHDLPNTPAATLLAVNMEGPFISRKKKGAQNERYILPCNLESYKRFQTAANGLVGFVGLAPEMVDTEDMCKFVREVSKETRVSLAHTNADYQTAKAAIEAGAAHVTHMFNAMSPYNHRDPGVVGAAAECEHVMAELICDGIHVHPTVIRNSFRLFGKDRLILISDSMRAAGLPDGIYTLGGQKVHVKGRRAVLADDPTVIAGSVTTLPDCVRRSVKFMGIPLEEALAAATINPARSLGASVVKDYGSIEAGKKADLVLWNRELSLKTVIKNGKIVQNDPHKVRL